MIETESPRFYEHFEHFTVPRQVLIFGLTQSAALFRFDGVLAPCLFLNLRLIGLNEIAESLFYKEVLMNKKYVVRLSDAGRLVCDEVVQKLKGSSGKVRRAQVLLKADADGPEGREDCRGVWVSRADGRERAAAVGVGRGLSWR